MLLSVVTSSGKSISGFVLDYSDAFWQVPLMEDEQKYFCASTTIKKKKKWLAFLRVAQGSTNACCEYVHVPGDILFWLALCNATGCESGVHSNDVAERSVGATRVHFQQARKHCKVQCHSLALTC